MRHRVSGRKLGRDTSHRNALRKNMMADLFCHEQILTTEAKARMLRPAAEKIITLAKHGLANRADDPAREVHARRLAAARVARIREYEEEGGYLEEVNVIKKLFEEIAPRYAERNGGYTRMIKVGKRPGDNADMAILMLIEKKEK